MRRKLGFLVPFLLLLIVAGVTGCASCRNGETESPEAERKTKAAKEKPVPVGTVEGTIELAQGAELPKYTLADLGVREEQPPLPESCAPFGEPDQSPLRLSAARGIGGVLVAAADFARSPPHERVRHPVKIVDCRLTPPLIVATRGDVLVLTNETKVPFLPVLGRASFSQAVLPGQSQSIPLDRGTHLPLTCAFSLPCGRSDVTVLHHPVHTQTDDDGRFRLTDVPAGQKITIYAWHPLLKEVAASIVVEPGKTTKVELTTTPAPSREPENESPEGAEAEPSKGGDTASADKPTTSDRAEDHPEKLF